MKINYLDNVPFHFPEELNELTARQLEVIIGFIHQNLEIKTAKLEILKAFFYHNWAILWLFFKNDTLIPLLDWLTFGKFTWTQRSLGEGSLIDMIKSASSFLFESENYLTKQLYPEICIHLTGFIKRKIKLYGPLSELVGISFKEFIVADFQYRMYTKTRDEKHLNKLCAVLYRLKNQVFTDDDWIDLTAKMFEYHVPLTRKLTIFQFYDGCYKQIVDNHPHLFPKPVEGKERKEVTVTSIIEQYEMWKSVPAEFAEKPDEVSKQEEVSLHNVIRFLDHKAMQNEKLRELAERNK